MQDHGQATTSEMPSLTIPDAFKTQLAGLFDAYLQLQTALAADDGSGDEHGHWNNSNDVWYP